MAENELERRLREAKSDFAEGLGAATILIEQNTSETAKIERKVHSQAEELRDLRDRLTKLEAQVPGDLRERLATTEHRTRDIREETGKIRHLEIESAKDTGGTEREKAKWGATATIVAALVAAASALILQLIQMVSSSR